MHPSTLRKLNVGLFLLLVLAAGGAALSWLTPAPPPVELQPPPPRATAVPYSFTVADSHYTVESLRSFLRLNKLALPTRLPDLRSTFLYYGQNTRPDTAQNRAFALVSVRGNPTPSAIPLNEPIYLQHTARSGMHQWSFSDGNQETPLWLVGRVHENILTLAVAMKDHEGAIVATPDELATISLTELPFHALPRNDMRFEIDNQPVDQGFLAKQHASWYGQDEFLRLYGGEEYSHTLDCERIEFGDDENAYACFVSEQDLLAYSNGTWQLAEPGPATANKPLLHVKSITETAIAFDLWDPSGKIRYPLELHRTPPPPQESRVEIKLLGARSRKEWIASVNGKRTFLRHDDWVLFNNDTFEVITTSAQIDAYIQGQQRGKLLILNGSPQALAGTLINEARTSSNPMRVSLQKIEATPAKSPPISDDDDSFSDDDEEDFDDWIDDDDYEDWSDEDEPQDSPDE